MTTLIKLLQGVRVLECAILPSGDQAGRLLADLGADVVKIEQPGIGDYIRDMGGTLTEPRQSPFHLALNRNKRSITLNLRSDEGRTIFYRLLEDADIIIDGFAGNACAKLGIGYEDLRKAKPDIIYCQVNGFGARGPYAQIPTHGVMMAAAAGAVNLTDGDDGLAKEVPPSGHLVHPGQPDAPLLGALFGALSAVAALQQRRRTGEGAYIDAAGTDAVVATQGMDATAEWNAAWTIPDPNPPIFPGLETRLRPKYAYYKTKDDKYVMFAGIEHKFWDNFCHAIGREDLIRFKDEAAMADFQMPVGGEHLAEELQAIFRDRNRAEWIELAVTHDIPIGPANMRHEIADDPSFLEREVVSITEHPQAGRFITVGWPAPIAGQPFEVTRHAPLIGQHTDEVLSSLGFGADDVDRLRLEKII